VLDWVLNVAREFWLVLGEMAPYLLFGFLFAGILSAYISPEFIERHLGKRGIMSIFKASLFGVPLPLCSCGVLPVAASLRKSGASKGATASFLLSTPQTGVDSILVTFSLLGPIFAIFRPIAAFLKGLIGGLLVEFFAEKNDIPQNNIRPNECTDSACCSSMPAKGGKLKHILEYGFITLPADIAKTLLIGLLIAGLISALVPENFFANTIGHGIWEMLIMMAIGIPMYVCATASVPIAAALVLTAGVSPGAALVFLMTGPATNAAAIAIVWKLLGKRTAIIYLFSVAAMALASGYLLDLVFNIQGVAAKPGMPFMLPSWFTSLSAIALLALLAYALFRKAPKAEIKIAGEEIVETKELKISGMTCDHCAQSVKRALAAMPGVGSVEVDMAAGLARIGGHDLDACAMQKSVEDLGFKVEDDEGKDKPCSCCQ
jgi:uncharacterized membrane protein YraQ (UPF0718 family)/copper chaperone CopZ